MSDDMATRLAIYRALVGTPVWVEVLQEALRVEEQGEQRYKELGYGEYHGWEWFEVHCPMPTLHRMVAAKLLDITVKTRSSTEFRVKNSNLVQEALATLATPVQSVTQEVPTDLFVAIVGHDNIKAILRYAIEAKERVGVLLQGPPASAKTLFLMELARLPDSYYCLAQTMSGPGLIQALRVYEPGILIIDELDRLDPGDIGVLNSLLATGIVIETKIGKSPPIQLNTKVFAAGINVHRLPQDLLSRFIKLRFPVYSQTQFVLVCRSILPREGCDEATATFIAEAVWSIEGERADIRQAVHIARLAQGERGRVEEIIRTLKRQGA